MFLFYRYFIDILSIIVNHISTALQQPSGQNRRKSRSVILHCILNALLQTFAILPTGKN